MSKYLLRASFSVKGSSMLSGLLLCTACLLMPVPAHAVDCSAANGMGLSTQADVDNFQAVYGPCDTIIGSLSIEGGPFTNLDGLNEVTNITEGLSIVQSSVASLAGLSNLENIGGPFNIRSQLAPSFSSLSGLSSLTSLGALSIEDSNFLTSLSGMTSLTNLGSLHLRNVRVLTSLAGLPAGLDVIKNLSLEGNDSLQSLVGLPAGSSMIEDLSIIENDNLQNLDGFTPLVGVQSLRIVGNPNLTSISALAGSKFDDSNDFPAFSDLTLKISKNPLITSLADIPNPPLALNVVVIDNMPLITNLNFLSGLLEVWGAVAIVNNVALSDCSSLSKVVDTVDDGFTGPNEFTSDPSLYPPDVFNGELILESNAQGCNSIAEILGSSGGEGIFMDGFETVPNGSSSP